MHIQSILNGLLWTLGFFGSYHNFAQLLVITMLIFHPPYNKKQIYTLYQCTYQSMVTIGCKITIWHIICMSVGYYITGFILTSGHPSDGT